MFEKSDSLDNHIHLRKKNVNTLLFSFLDKTIDDICEKNPRLIFKSDTECHRYYDCSKEDEYLSSYIFYGMWPSKFKHECRYPFMFSENTLQCENYTEVSCGKRFKPTWECQ